MGSRITLTRFFRSARLIDGVGRTMAYTNPEKAYRVKAITNRIEPDVGTILTVAEVKHLMGRYDVTVHIVEPLKSEDELFQGRLSTYDRPPTEEEFAQIAEARIKAHA